MSTDCEDIFALALDEGEFRPSAKEVANANYCDRMDRLQREFAK
jgi:hypothetical protein